MKKLILPFAFVAMLSLALLPTGCGSLSGSSVGVNTSSSGTITGTAGIPLGSNATVNVNVTGNPGTGEVSGGVSITFKQAPSLVTVNALRGAGAVVSKQRGLLKSTAVWTLPGFDRNNPAQMNAVELSLREGATLSKR